MTNGAVVLLYAVALRVRFFIYLSGLWIKTNVLQSTQVKRTPQDYINEFFIQKLNPLEVADYRFMSAFLHAYYEP